MRRWLRERNGRREHVLKEYYASRGKPPVGSGSNPNGVRVGDDNGETGKPLSAAYAPTREDRLRALPVRYRNAETSAYLNSVCGSTAGSSVDVAIDDDNLANEKRLRKMAAQSRAPERKGKRATTKNAQCRKKLTSVPLNAALAMSISLDKGGLVGRPTGALERVAREEESQDEDSWVNDGYVFEKIGTMYPEQPEYRWLLLSI